MPRVDGGGGGRFHIDGVYEKLLRAQCAEAYEPDPRVLLFGDAAATEAYELAKAEGLRRAAVLFEERLEAGEPFGVSSLRFGGHSIPRRESWPAWLLPRSDVRSVRVYADDTVEAGEVVHLQTSRWRTS